MSKTWFKDPKLLNRVLADEIHFPRSFFGVDYINPTTDKRTNLLDATIKTIELVPCDPSDNVIVVELASPPKEEPTTQTKA